MKEKKERLLQHCRDLLCEEAFNMPYDKVKLTYTDNQINNKMDDFLTDLIKRGELFYGSNFIDDFINERTDEARKYLITDLRYGNGVDPVTEVKTSTDVSPQNNSQTTLANSSSVSKQNSAPQEQKQVSEPANENEPAKKDNLEIEEPKVEETYEELFNNLVNEYGWPEDIANQFIADGTKNEEIRKQALENLNKQNKEPDITNEETKELEQQEDSKNIPAGMKPVVEIKEPKKGLIQKFKEKWQDPKFKRKVIIGGALVAIGAVAIAALALNPEMQSFISHLLPNLDVGQLANSVDTSSIDGNVLNNVAQSTDVSQVATGLDINSIDTSAFDPEGMTVYSSASDALTGNNPAAANEWFSSNFQGLYDVSAQEVVPLSPDDLQNIDKVQELIQNNPNLVPYAGNGEINTLNDVSGFVNIDDVVNHISQGRSR